MDDDSSITSPSADAELPILNRFLAELRAAEGEEKSAVVARHCLFHPTLAERFRKIAAGTVNIDSLLAATGPVSGAWGSSTGPGATALPLCFGPYRVLRMIGRGGMGEVYEAKEEKLPRHVAVKTVRRSKSTEQGILERFDRERQVLARLHHTHIVPIFATGQEGEVLYFAMPYIPGVSLNDVIRTAKRHSHANGSGPLSTFADLVDEARSESSQEPRPERQRRPESVVTDPVPAAPQPTANRALLTLPMPYFRAVVSTMAQVAEAVHYAHQDGIIHRDLKPSNIMVERTGHPWVLDFGLARLKSGQAQSLTTVAANNGHKPGVASPPVQVPSLRDDPHPPLPSLTAGMVGTIPYMSPEQLAMGAGDGRLEMQSNDDVGRVDARTDVWSLGATLYELLTLHKAFETRDQILETEPTPPREIVRNFPRELESICLKALRKDPLKRYQTAKELTDDLRCWLEFKPSTVQRNPIHRFKLWSRRNPLLAPSLVASLLLAIGLAVVGVLALAADAAKLRAQGEHQLALLVQAKHRERQHQRETLLHTMQRTRLSSHVAGWSDEAWRLLFEAKALDVGDHGEMVNEPLQSSAVASLLGLDARRTKRFEYFGASSVAYDSKGERLLMGGVISKDGETPRVKIWDERLLSPRDLPGGGSGPVGFRPDGTPIQVVSHAWRAGEPGRLELIDLEKGRLAVGFPLRESGKLALENGDVRCVAMSADGALVAAMVEQGLGPRMLHVWDGQSGQLVRRLEFSAKCVAFSPDRLFVAAGNGDGRVDVWSLRTGQSITSFSQGRMPVQCLAFGRNPLRSPTEPQAEQGHQWLLAAGDRGATINIYDIGARKLLETCRGSHYSVSEVAFSPDGATLASTGPGPARLWDVATGQLLLSLSDSYSFGVTFSPDGKHLAIGNSRLGRPGLTTIWDLDNGHGMKTMRGLTGTVEKAIFSRDGHLVAATSQEWQVAVWDLESGTLLHVFNAPRGEFIDNASVAFSPDGRLLAFSGGNEVRMWDVASGQERGRWSFHPGFMDTLVFAGADQLLLLRMETKDEKARPNGPNAETNPRVVRIRNLLGPDPMRPLREIDDYNWHGHDVAASPDGSIFVVEGLNKSSGQLSRMVNAYEGATGMRLWSISTRRSPQVGGELRIDPSGRFLSFPADDSETRTLVETTSGRFLRTLDSHPQSLGPEAKIWVSLVVGRRSVDVAFSVFEQGRDHSLFNIEFDSFLPSTPSPKFSLNGRYLAWGNTDGSVIVCDLKEVNRRLTGINLGW